MDNVKVGGYQQEPTYQVGELEQDLIVFPTCRVFPDLGVSEIEIAIYYGDIENDDFFNDDLILVV